MSFNFIDQLIGLRGKVVGHICEREIDIERERIASYISLHDECDV